MRYLRKRYRILSLDELIREMAEPGQLEPAVAITFDDGYRDLFAQAFPILQAYQVPATIFLTVGSIETGEVAWYDRVFLALKVAPGVALDLVLDRPRRFPLSSTSSRMHAAVEIIGHLRSLSPARRMDCCAALESQVKLPAGDLADRMLTWKQVRTMHRAGVSFGSHTMSHPVVGRLTPAEMSWELLESKRILEEKLESPVRDFAFPFGKLVECGDTAAEMLAQGGYRSAATTEWGLNTPSTDPFLLRRVSIGEERSLAMFAFQLNRLILRADSEPPSETSVTSPGAGKYPAAGPQRARR
jgi:peptidoglycan/xylan/chitin deacetylase (PgdA/CDA1 family)